MGLNHFIFNGISSLDYGVYIGGQATFNAPQRDVSKISIPGRNGDLVRDNGRFLNIEVTYSVVIMDEFREKADEIRAWLKAPTSYVRIEDTYNPDYYRLGICTSSIDFDTLSFNEAGKTKITFDCKPQRFLKDGETFVAYSSDDYIFNPTRFDSKPLIRVHGTGSGTVSIWNYTATLTGISDYVDIDCDIMDCYKGATNCNDKVSFNSYGFPTLKSGRSHIAYTGDVTSVEIMSRYWTV